MRYLSTISKAFRVLPTPMQEFLYMLVPFSIPDFYANRIEFRYLPIEYEDFSTQYAVPVDVESPHLNYDPIERPYHEPLATRTYIKELSEGDVFWDLGSRYGYESTVAAELVGASNVHIFEAESAQALRLQRLSEIMFNGALTVNHTTVGASRSGQVSECTVLDDYAAKHKPPDFVKMDIEGAEADAVSGLTETIATIHPHLLIEVHPSKIATVSKTTYSEMLETLTNEYQSCVYSEKYRQENQNWKPFTGERLESTYQLFCRQ